MSVSFHTPFEVIYEYVLWLESEETKTTHLVEDLNEGQLFHTFADEISLTPDDRHDVAEILFNPGAGLFTPFDEMEG